MMEWSIRGLLNPVITRLLIYGVNPIDVEYVLSKVESINHKTAHSLEESWLSEWEKKADRYIKLAEDAEKSRNSLSAGQFYFFASQCYYAVFLINLARIEDKQKIYRKYARLYRKSLDHYPSRVESVDIPVDDKKAVAGCLHLPADQKEPADCVIIYSGLGSCKEEMHTLARPLVDRGLAVFVPDMPGNGESLFSRGIKCGIQNLKGVFSNITGILGARDEIKSGGFGAYGLCMGGGYAHYAASGNSAYALCVTLFPLFITRVEEGTTPQWMKRGKWYDYQSGGVPAVDFLGEMKALEEGTLQCPLLFIHGEKDNWMTLEKAAGLYDRAKGKKEKIIIEEDPVFSGGNAVTHTMPVGEQLHWLRHKAADWIVKEFQARG